MVLTLVSSSVARKGYSFTMLGEAEECEPCRYRNVCLGNLEVGIRYEVVGVRNKKHPCLLLQDGDKVTVCTVEARPATLTIKSKNAMPGVSVRFEAQKQCKEVGCKNWEYCNPPALPEGTKIAVEKVLEKKTECYLSLPLAVVTATPKLDDTS